MRFDEFCLRIPGDEFRMRFHDRLTVVGGIGAPERDELLTTILNAASGRLPNTTFRYVDEMGQTIDVVCDESGHAEARFTDGSPAPAVLDEMKVSLDDLRQAVRIDSTDLGITADTTYAGVHPELKDARQTLDHLTSQLQAAIDGEQKVEQLRDEIATIDERIRRAEEGQARRAYAKVLSELERVRAEAAAVRGGNGNSRSDTLLLERASQVEQLAEAWQIAVQRCLELEQAGEGQQLSDDELAEALAYPEAVPEEIHELVDDFRRAREEHDRLSAQLHSLAASRLPEPSDPLVADLARLDQDALWAAHATLIVTRRRAELAELGLPLDLEIDDPAAAVADLEAAHCALEEAIEEMEEARVKLLSSRRVSDCEERERRCLERLGLTSYLGFHVRRMEMSFDADARAEVDKVALDDRLAHIRWAELAGDVDPASAAELADEVRSYAAAVADLDDEADEMERLRLRLEKVAGPALAEARMALESACEPFGVDNVELAETVIRQKVDLGRRARLQEEAEAVVVAQEQAATALEDGLLNAGFSEGDLAARLGAFRWAVERARERETARESARSQEAVELDLMRLEEEANRLRRPEWANVTAADAGEPDLDELRTRRATAEAAFEAAQALAPNIDHLRDRHRAMVRKVGLIEERLREQGVLDASHAEQVQHHLMAKLTAARHFAPAGISLPVVIDDAFRQLDPEQKAEMLDLLDRLAERVQVIYFTDDVDVAVWARRHSGSGNLTLLEPVDDDARVAV